MSGKVTINGREFDLTPLSTPEAVLAFLQQLDAEGVLTGPSEQEVVLAMRELKPGGEVNVRRNARAGHGFSYHITITESRMI